MKSGRTYIISLLLLSIVSCKSMLTSIVDPVITPLLLISYELSTITAVAVAHKDSVGYWPQNRVQLSSFYENHEQSFASDSLFQKISFSEPNFKSLEFSEYADSLIVSFVTLPLPDTLYSSFKKPGSRARDLNFYEYVGSITLFQDSTAQNTFSSYLILDSIVLYDSQMKSHGNILHK